MEHLGCEKLPGMGSGHVYPFVSVTTVTDWNTFSGTQAQGH